MLLGFGYHPENMRRLRIQDWIKPQVSVVGSTYAMVGHEVDRVSAMFGHLASVRLQDRDCLALVRHNVAILD